MPFINHAIIHPPVDRNVAPGAPGGARDVYARVIKDYEINYSGSHEEIRRYALFGALASGQYDRWKQFAESCMAEYDLDGWTVKDLVDTRKAIP